MKFWLCIATCALCNCVSAQAAAHTAASLHPENMLCEQQELIGSYMCTMNDGTSANRTYSNEVLLSGREFTDLTSGANDTIRPDIIVRAAYTSTTLMSSITAKSIAYLDMFLCSESTCNSYVDIQYIRNGHYDYVGFMVGVIPHTRVAIGVPLRGQQGTATYSTQSAPSETHITSVSKVVLHQSEDTDAVGVGGYAVLGTRVNFEAYTDYLLSEPSIGFSSYYVDNVCSYILYPNNAWYQQYIIYNFTECSRPTQTLALMGVFNGNWCMFCDPPSTSIVNHRAGCYVTNLGSCDAIPPYNIINKTVDVWQVRMYNLTDDIDPNKNNQSYLDQTTYLHPWDTVLMEIVAEARAGTPAGCNDTAFGSPLCVKNGCDFAEGVSYVCPAAESMATNTSNGYADLSLVLRNYWVAEWQGSDQFSMLGNERITVSQLKSGVNAVERWAYRYVSLSVEKTANSYSRPSNAKGYVITFLINLAAAIGAWSAYPDISAWISKIASAVTGRARADALGRSIACITTMAITLLPFVIIVITDFSVNNSNSDQVSYMQQAFDAPGYGSYKIVAIIQVNGSPVPSYLPLIVGIPLTAVMLMVGIVAVMLTEITHRNRASAQQDAKVAKELLLQHEKNSSDIEMPRILKRATTFYT